MQRHWKWCLNWLGGMRLVAVSRGVIEVGKRYSLVKKVGSDDTIYF